LETYERALARLPADKQEAVFLRIEMGYTHEEVAAELDLRSADAARMLVARALVQLSEVMRER
jgi:DNA-directed RNA polymerase specialized sigma24 family protein